MRFYTTERLSDTRTKTPEGYLLISGAPLARTGEMLYGPGESPVEPGRDGFAHIWRDAEEVFSPCSVASYSAKSLVDDHPEDDVGPHNWSKLTKGIILNPRQGDGDQKDLLLGDILVTDPEIIEAIEGGEQYELSAGYDADYEDAGPGKGRQKNIIINHVALVPQGRCGPRCRIGDSQTKRTFAMKLSDVLQRAFKAKDKKELDALEKEIEKENPELVGEKPKDNEGEGEHTHVHVHLNGNEPMGEKREDDKRGKRGGRDDEGTEQAEGGTTEERLSRLEALMESIAEKLGVEDRRDRGHRDNETEEEREKRERKESEDRKRAKDDESIEGALEMEAPPGTEDKARKARDSAYLEDAWNAHQAHAEIVSPGARMSTFDRSARPAVTLSKLCGARAQLLEHAYMSGHAETINTMNGGHKPDFKKMTCDSARMMIAHLAMEIGRKNNGGGTPLAVGTHYASAGHGGGLGQRGKIKTIADLNKVGAELYKRP